ncbi:hypothetical protein DFJ58DRAFT_35307 [Suillus subalutaceus]|uniref:uncharacterized protein n=1 Tax=Suillus subalutaceus TaxID=48586 RepID=UPI001B8645BD|nr:uncharacterized protein DFJ58DRAFT_35307 [Suillus subalutaceus]KAG1843810.1 hypothetical protein DFJ58DRAFT_35307 [Suillus subalutaceus]
MHMKRVFKGEDGAREPLEGGDWEDIPNMDVSPERFNNSDSPSTTSTFTDASKPRRRAGSKPVFIAESPRRNRAATPRSKRKKGPIVDNEYDLDKENVIDKEQIKEALSTGAHHSSIFILDVFLRAVRLMRIPLSIMLFLWMLAFVMIRLSGALRTAFSPMCYLPIVSRSALCAPLDPQITKWADFPQLMETQGSTFEKLLEGSVGGSGLSIEIRKAEFATADLATLVRYSDLKSNEILADLLATFAKDAKNTARGLTKLSSKIGGAVDNVMAVNGYAMRTIQEAEKNAPQPYSLMALIPFNTGPTTQEVIVDTFTTAMDTFSVAIQRLILEAEISLHNLEILEQDLSAVREVVLREDVDVTAEKSELLASLWTTLGRNRRALRDTDRRLDLLKDLVDYRKRAQAHVVAALQTLNSMSEDMEDLRERVAAPELVDGRIPLHVHIESIQSGLQRLQDGRVRAKEREEEVMRNVLGLGTD